ncbi:universal stress protein [Brachybacterium hainanense]|uniref:Universal stress protein n=1 Tax=Brachybacterium hainanense TaxID=1541174 RepID=A0ABV6RDI4_9MICO
MAVVVGFIPTPVGFAALEAAHREAERRGGPLIIVNVVRDDVGEDPRHADAGQLERAQDMVRRSSVRIAVRQEHTDDDVSDVLVQVVEEEGAELLVVGIRRERDMARHLLGITIQKLLTSSPSDVLVV